jgi:hypothetical protein
MCTQTKTGRGFLLFSNIQLPTLRKTKRGDVIFFKNPKNEKDRYVKRAIAFPRESVETVNKAVYIERTF